MCRQCSGYFLKKKPELNKSDTDLQIQITFFL